MSFADLLTVVRRYLYLPDPSPLEVVLGTVVGNRIDGDPVWLLLVGPPSSGKTELLAGLSALSDVYPVSTFTEAGLLSGGTSHRPGATGGLLAEMGTFGIIVCKDFTSLLSEAPQTRSGLVAALREIYDGCWIRRLGADGGRTLVWAGKCGLLAAVTETIERHSAVIGAMGERFVWLRMPELDDEGRLAQARASAANVGRQAEMRADLAQAIAGFLAEVTVPPVTALSADEREALVLLADLATRCRSVVERDPRDREIELIPQPEAASRMLAALTQLVSGLLAIGIERAEIGRLVLKVALDGMPKARRMIVEHLLGMPVGMAPRSSAIADILGLPTSATTRALEELAAHGVVERNASGNVHCWSAPAWLTERWTALGLPTRGRFAPPSSEESS
ncbi:MAG TPA: hypothetical protein VK217_07740 [Acidimicrobiales bacterium]|nr:hypothetical protein [Acidimicrobiales bacterium]